VDFSTPTIRRKTPRFVVTRLGLTRELSDRVFDAHA